MADTKDWTWVLDRPCPECGYDAAAIGRGDVGRALRAVNDAIIARLAETGLVRSRPSPSVWSAVEYACHVRDVHRLFLTRLTLMLDQHDPRFANWDQDSTAEASDYAATDLDELRADLAADGERLAAAFDAVGDDQWERRGFRSDGAIFTVETFGKYLVHDPYHHLWDIDAGFAALRSGA